MNRERSAEIEFLRGELVGPARPLDTSSPHNIVSFDAQHVFQAPVENSGALFWIPEGSQTMQEVIYYRGETPLQRYGAGLLHPRNNLREVVITDEPTMTSLDMGELTDVVLENDILSISQNDDVDFPNLNGESVETRSTEIDDDFEVTSVDMYQPSVMGVSFCLEDNVGEIVVALPPQKKFFWQLADVTPFPINGTYEHCTRVLYSEEGKEQHFDAWRRVSATTTQTLECFLLDELQNNTTVSRDLELSCGLQLQIQLFPRLINGKWFITCVLRNQCDANSIKSQAEHISSVLFQAYFEVRVQKGAKFGQYPEGIRPFEQFDADEQTLALLYRDEATWAIGHSCAAGWESVASGAPKVIFADIMPAVELPSMTPNITGLDGKQLTLSMRELAGLSPFKESTATEWRTLAHLTDEYGEWINAKKKESKQLEPHYFKVVERHLKGCEQCLTRIRRGIEILQTNEDALEAFKLANQSMLLQQIASKQIVHRPLSRFDGYVAAQELPSGMARTPWDVWLAGTENTTVGRWRAFQIAFLLMSIAGLVDEDSDDREIVDLIWFPTGGGKTEAYLVVSAFYMFHQRLISRPSDRFQRDGTNVFMRYTLRMLTTQQFQRAASLICAMEQIRVHLSADNTLPQLGKRCFSLGLWIGGDGSPNTWDSARAEINKFRRSEIEGNPLVLTECPWCRSAIGRLDSERSIHSAKNNNNNLAGLAGLNKHPYLKCSDANCPYGTEYSNLPIEVIDEAIYENPPSMFIGTVDKFAMMAWKPKTGALFGFQHDNTGIVRRTHQPPGLIIQDEFHLISGPLGTIYGLYEGVIEKFCSVKGRSKFINPKIIASTATIRGATEQVRAVYAREKLQLFPSPGLQMGDSFFGCYAKENDKLSEGRLYLGIHASGYRSFLTTQVRTFSAMLFRAKQFDDYQKDAWWTLLAFYNSLRELGGARTLFDSDISARLKDYSNRYGLKGNEQRYLNSVEELTSRCSQAELVQMMDRLTLEWHAKGAIDACLASSIIEVGVDIDRLAIMAVVGQPKSTAQYIQVTGRVGRRWADRPGLILSMYNPSKSRDRSHFEQFHSYHRRLYERVEPTSATPYSVEAVERAFAGVLLVWVRQNYDSKSPGSAFGSYERHLEEAFEYFQERCKAVMEKQSEEAIRVCKAMENVFERLRRKWKNNPLEWWEYPQKVDGEYLMLWSSEYSTLKQKRIGERILSSMRNVDGNARAAISDNYLGEELTDGQ